MWIFLKKKKNFLYLLSSVFYVLFFALTFFSLTKTEVWEVPGWINLGERFIISIALSFNQKAVFLALLNALITLLIQIYSFSYFSQKENFGFYNFLISSFSAAMSWLLLAANLFTMLLAWEMVGLVSYLLVQFWYREKDPLRAGLRVFFINKIGDLALISGLGFLISFGLGQVVFDQTIFPEGSDLFFKSINGNLIIMFLVVATFVKSAQFPFSIWLKEAMNGPTSVSALLHSATMVISGIWMLSQLEVVLSDEVKMCIVLVGGLTLLISNFAAIFSSHFKNILAFSTMAQLGLMTMGIGLSKTDGVIFHLISHAFFKSSLFLICGILMHQLEHSGFQKEESHYLPNLSGLLKKKSVLKVSLIACLAALAGWPLTSGFISKESIVPHIFGGNASVSEIIGFVFFELGALTTAFYATRLGIFLTLKDPAILPEAEKVNWKLRVPVFILSLGSGFWLFGYNPFSSFGWISQGLELEAGFVFPDIIALAIGSMGAWFFSKGNTWREIQIPFMSISIFNDFKPQIFLLKSAWKGLVFTSKKGLQVENVLLNQSLDFGSKSMVVFGHFSSFFDKRFLDGFIDFLVFIVKTLGQIFYNFTYKSPQNAALVAVALILFFVYFF